MCWSTLFSKRSKHILPCEETEVPGEGIRTGSEAVRAEEIPEVGMTREEILAGIKKFFDVDELVCDHTFAKYGEGSWKFLDTDYLHALLIIRRDIIKLPMWCNSKTAKQKGLRCNRCPMVKQKTGVYLSAHVFGKAGDFTVTGMKAQAVRDKIKENADLLPCKVRLERWDASGNEISWFHIDTIDEEKNPKVYEFHA